MKLQPMILRAHFLNLLDPLHCLLFVKCLYNIIFFVWVKGNYDGMAK